MKTTDDKIFYFVTFKDLANSSNKSENISLKVKSIDDSTLGPTFIALSDFVFDDPSVIVDPVQEKLRARYQDTKKIHISIYSVLSIEEVGANHQGLTLDSSRSNLMMFPSEQ